MRLPTRTIDSFRRSCNADIERIWKFMDLKTPQELRASHSIRTLQSFRETLRLQWSQMDTAWRNHHLADSDEDITVLKSLDAIVEAPYMFCESQAKPSLSQPRGDRQHHLTPSYRLIPPYRTFTAGSWTPPTGTLHTPGRRHVPVAWSEEPIKRRLHLPCDHQPESRA